MRSPGTTDPSRREQRGRRPVCGAISVLLPVLLAAIEMVAFLPTFADWEGGGYAWLFVTMVVMAAAPVLGTAGVILGISALIRRERAAWLPLVGLTVNTALVLMFFPVLLRVLARL